MTLTSMLRPQDAGYEAARTRMFNKKVPNSKPSNIVFPQTEHAVVDAVRLAVEQGLQISVRSGGHSWAGWPLREGCVLIEMSKLDIFDLDVDRRLITVSSSMTGGRLNAKLGEGLSFLGGHCPDVGLGGFLLQGGQGWGAGYLGWACEQIESFRAVVVPSKRTEGKVKHLTCSRTQNQDLFWAARGSGPGFFGVITAFTLRLRPTPVLTGSVYFFDTEECYDELALWYLKKCRDMKGRLELVMLGYRSDKVLPQLSPVRPVLLIRPLIFDYDADSARATLQEYEKDMPFLGTKHNHLRVFNEPSSLGLEYERQWSDNPDGRYFVQNAWLDGPLEAVADSMRHAYMNIPSKATYVLHYFMDTSRAAALPRDMCFDIETPHTFSVYSIARADTTSEDVSCDSYVKKTFEIIDSRMPSQGGAVGIYLGDSDLRTRRARFMGEENWQRWKKLRSEYDPDRILVGYDGEDDDASWNKNKWELDQAKQ